MSEQVATPTLNYMREVNHESQVIGEFIEWLGDNGMHIAEYLRCDGSMRTIQIQETTEKLLARYFGIDLVKAEKERRALLAAIKS